MLIAFNDFGVGSNVADVIEKAGGRAIDLVRWSDSVVEVAARKPPDLIILDAVGLSEEPVDLVTKALLELGIPLILVTRSSAAPLNPLYSQHPFILDPTDEQQVLTAVESALLGGHR